MARKLRRTACRQRGSEARRTAPRDSATEPREGRRTMKIETAKQLDVYHMAYQLAMEIFQVSKRFPQEDVGP